ncbi:MAG: hypothetical protein COA79_14745 [Planctomycetota bacterium]|nr:MAG: hypothetical protein COA79_14745 [Planctomycetota bacterium]
MNPSDYEYIWKNIETELGIIVLEKNVPFNTNCSVKLCDRSISLKRIEELIRSGFYILVEDDFKFALNVLAKLKKSLSRSKPTESRNAKYFYKKEMEWKQKKSILTSRVLFKSDKWKSVLEIHQQLNLSIIKEISLLTEECFSKIMPVKQILALNSSYQRYVKGVSLFGFQINPFYGVYLPVRTEPIFLLDKYLNDNAKNLKMLEIGVGSGILSFISCKHGHQIHATDKNLLSILSCKKNSIELNLDSKIQLFHQQYYNQDKYDLIVCNPPWIPKNTENLLDQAIFYADDFFDELFGNLKEHLNENGKLLLIYSNFASLVGLQSISYIDEMADKYYLTAKVIDQLNKTQNKGQELENSFRKDEIVSLYEIKLK